MGIELRFKNITTRRKSVTEVTYKAETFEELWQGVDGFLKAQEWDTSKIVARQLDTIDRMANRQVDGIERAAAKKTSTSMINPALYEGQNNDD